jgi:hypothetical protein
VLGTALEQVEGGSDVLTDGARRVASGAVRVRDAGEVEDRFTARDERAHLRASGFGIDGCDLRQGSAFPPPRPRDRDDIVSALAEVARDARPEEPAGTDHEQLHESPAR